jgi:hypothetical protein
LIFFIPVGGMMKNHWHYLLILLLGELPPSADAGRYRHKKHNVLKLAAHKKRIECSDNVAKQACKSPILEEPLLDELWENAPTELCTMVKEYVKPHEILFDIEDALTFRSRETFDRKLDGIRRYGEEIDHIFLKGPDCFRLGKQAWESFIDTLKTLPNLQAIRLKFSSNKLFSGTLSAAFIMSSLSALTQVDCLVWSDVDCARKCCDRGRLEKRKELLVALLDLEHLKTLVIDTMYGSSPGDVRSYASEILSCAIQAMPNLHTLAFYKTTFDERVFASFKNQLELASKEHLHTVIFDGSAFNFKFFVWCIGDFELYTTSMQGGCLPAADHRQNYLVAQRKSLNACEHCLDLSRAESGWIAQDLLSIFEPS